MFVACDQRYLDIVNYLLNQSVYVNLSGYNGLTALFYGDFT